MSQWWCVLRSRHLYHDQKPSAKCKCTGKASGKGNGGHVVAQGKVHICKVAFAYVQKHSISYRHTYHLSVHNDCTMFGIHCIRFSPRLTGTKRCLGASYTFVSLLWAVALEVHTNASISRLISSKSKGSRRSCLGMDNSWLHGSQ